MLKKLLQPLLRPLRDHVHGLNQKQEQINQALNSLTTRDWKEMAELVLGTDHPQTHRLALALVQEKSNSANLGVTNQVSERKNIGIKTRTDLSHNSVKQNQRSTKHRLL